jgi:hypothetical protein
MDLDEIHQLLRKARAGDQAARVHLFESFEPKLKRIAQGALKRERPDHSLKASELSRLVFERVIDVQTFDPLSSDHLLAVFANAVRTVLIDHARSRRV